VADAKGSRLPRALCVVRGQGRADPSIRPQALGKRRSSTLHYPTNERRSPHPQHPSGVRQAPRVFCGAFVFRNRAKCSSERVPFISILLKPADLCQKRRWDRLWRPACVLEPSARTPANLGPDHSSGRDLFRQRRRPARPPAGDHGALVQVGVNEQPRKTARSAIVCLWNRKIKRLPSTTREPL
jgi:hypothetical protein